MDFACDLPPEREWVLAERPAKQGVRDAVNAWLEADDASLGMRFGVEALAEAWDAHEVWIDLAFADGRVYQLRATAPPLPARDPSGRAAVRGTRPVCFTCVEPFRRWTLAGEAALVATDAAALARGKGPPARAAVAVSYTFDLLMAAPPWVSGTLLPEARVAAAAGDGAFLSPRHEQLFVARGHLVLAGQSLEFAGRGLRIRRQGVRRFAGFRGHCWQSALFPDGRAFGYNAYPPKADGTPGYNEGFVWEGGRLTPARAVEIPWLDSLRPAGDEVSFALETADGRRLRIQGETFVNTRSLGGIQTELPADFPVVQQAHARYRWDGVETVGMVERSTPAGRLKG